MKKIQLPVLGGMRKVILPGGNNTVAGTTIAEVGAGTITLAQLAALITNIQDQQTNNGGGNIGSGSGGFIVLGPGLSGGGPIVGNVPIRLTAPIPWDGDGGGGSDGDPGPPGAAGAAGAAGANGATGGVGPAGPAVFLEAEPGEDGLWAIPGPIGAQGPTGATGPTGPQGPSGSGSGGGGTGTLMFMVPEDNSPDEEIFRGPASAQGYLSVNGPLVANGGILSILTTQTNSVSSLSFGNGTFPLGTLAQIGWGNSNGIMTIAAQSIGLYTGNAALTQILQINSVGSVSLSGATLVSISAASTALVVANASGSGLLIKAGSNNTNYALLCSQNSTTLPLFGVMGDGGATIGSASSRGYGTLSVQNQITIRGDIIRGGSGMMADETWTDEEIYRGPTNGPQLINGKLVVNGPIDQNGAATFTSSVSMSGATPPVTAGQTALGITTTATVITTAGGIALPALASTFWVVNVNGVQYGIPCFAL